MHLQSVHCVASPRYLSSCLLYFFTLARLHFTTVFSAPLCFSVSTLVSGMTEQVMNLCEFLLWCRQKINLSSSRQHLTNGDCPEDMREIISTVLCGIVYDS